MEVPRTNQFDLDPKKKAAGRRQTHKASDRFDNVLHYVLLHSVEEQRDARHATLRCPGIITERTGVYWIHEALLRTTAGLRRESRQVEREAPVCPVYEATYIPWSVSLIE